MSGNAPLWTAAEQLDRARAAVIVVDLQNDFTHPDGHLARRKGVDVTPVRHRFPAAARLVAGARRGGVPVIWLSVVHDLEAEPANYLAAQLRGQRDAQAITADDVPAHRGTWGSAWDAALPAPLDSEPCIEKPGYDGFHRTPLSGTLDALGVTTLVFCGCNTNVCIQATAATGFARGYYTILASDACAALDGEDAHATALATHRKYYGHTVTVSEILPHWLPPGPPEDNFPAIP